MPTVPQRDTRFAAVLAVAALALNPWVIGYAATDDGAIGPPHHFAAVLMLSAACVLGALQVRWRWVDRLSWTATAGPIRSVAVVGLFALLIAGTYWRVASYQRAHNHTTTVAAEHEHVTAAQQQWAEDFYRQSLAAAVKHGWFDINKAFAQGFQVDRVNGSHFPNLQYMFDDVLLDPERPEWLIYDDSPDGKVLMGFMFFTRELEEVGPTPAGSLAQWHFHPYETPRCAVKGLWTVGRVSDDGTCAEGIPVSRTPEMFHVWFMDHPLGRFTEMDIVLPYGEEAKFNRATLHPIMVHFAIALFIVAVLLDIAGVATAKRDLHRAAWINLVIAAIAVVAAVFSGVTAELVAKPTHEAHQTLDTHKLLAFGSLGGILLLFSWRYLLRGHFPQRGVAMYVLLSVGSVGAIAGASYYGGEMVYTHGTGVRAIDVYTRDRYFNQVRAVYRNDAAAVQQGVQERAPAHTGH